ncbi:MAG: penicillin-binding protein 2 [Chthoniobacterales bacterium]|nr:penicillin-binding protein 2 [Chthoniobacterales bacterium]
MRSSVVTIAILLAAATSRAAGTPHSDVVEVPQPTWETQKQARTYLLHIPAPRGQITDRNGAPMAQSRVSYNLGLSFPTPLEFTDGQAVNFARSQILTAEKLLGRKFEVTDEALLQHYKNRGILPFILAEDLGPEQITAVSRGLGAGLVLQPAYVRYYPLGALAAHIVGYVGRVAPLSVKPIENKDLIFPDSEGREGLEQVFDDELRGTPGVVNVTLNAEGKRTHERIVQQPVPGYNVITTLDLKVQKACEDALAKTGRRGAVVVIDPRSGEILGMASRPSFDPNVFIPIVRPEVFDKLNNDPTAPLYPRAFRSAYPPGSTFKTFVGLAALQSGLITAETELSCPGGLQVGNFYFRNWKSGHSGQLNLAEALAQSCNTWFYQAGLKIGAAPIIEWATALGLGKRTGIPLGSESRGNIPDDDYMLRVHKRRILQGDVANMSIGQGDILITPLQMAQAMGVIAADGSFHQTRLVKQVQSINNQPVSAYQDRVRAELNISEQNLADLTEGLVKVTTSGTGSRAATVKGVKVAGKTGTAQWGPVSKRRNAAWFGGFAPADNPLYAFAAVIEGNPGETIAGGANAAPVIGSVLATLLKDYKPPKPEEEKKDEPEEKKQAEDKKPGVDEADITEDVMNPQGAPEAAEGDTPAAGATQSPGPSPAPSP